MSRPKVRDIKNKSGKLRNKCKKENMAKLKEKSK
jgi:hypothetical protein